MNHWSPILQPLPPLLEGSGDIQRKSDDFAKNSKKANNFIFSHPAALPLNDRDEQLNSILQSCWFNLLQKSSCIADTTVTVMKPGILIKKSALAFLISDNKNHTLFILNCQNYPDYSIIYLNDVTSKILLY